MQLCVQRGGESATLLASPGWALQGGDARDLQLRARPLENCSVAAETFDRLASARSSRRSEVGSLQLSWTLLNSHLKIAMLAMFSFGQAPWKNVAPRRKHVIDLQRHAAPRAARWGVDDFTGLSWLGTPGW